jgi:hypothetical protein
VPVRCIRGGLCAWEPTPNDDDVSGHSILEFPKNFEIAHVDDPGGGHLVRLRFEDAEDERSFLVMLEREGEAIAARS